MYPPVQAIPDGKTGATMQDITTQQAAKKECEIQLEDERKRREVMDLSTALALLVIGGATFAFHYRKTRE
ncbi:hypothetical protein HGB07_05185 [Candidatus Roizmanbacteria bacterium]|nr:hypothetical protein [Candidatus Roizmanbacteria bacterium]